MLAMVVAHFYQMNFNWMMDFVTLKLGKKSKCSLLTCIEVNLISVRFCIAQKFTQRVHFLVSFFYWRKFNPSLAFYIQSLLYMFIYLKSKFWLILNSIQLTLCINTWSYRVWEFFKSLDFIFKLKRWVFTKLLI